MDRSVVSNYFDTEIEKMIRFLYSDINKMDIPFKVPEYLSCILRERIMRRMIVHEVGHFVLHYKEQKNWNWRAYEFKMSD